MEAKQRNIQLRDRWSKKLSDWHAYQLVFLDVSGINSKLVQRKSKKDKTSCNLSLVPALSKNGYLACKLYQGNVDTERFEEFVRTDVLSQCTPYPGPNSIIVMDNASMHRGEVRFDLDSIKRCSLLGDPCND
jgi:hypothetical protein